MANTSSCQQLSSANSASNPCAINLCTIALCTRLTFQHAHIQCLACTFVGDVLCIAAMTVEEGHVSAARGKLDVAQANRQHSITKQVALIIEP